MKGNFFIIFDLKSSLPFFFPKYGFFFSIKWFFPDLDFSLFSFVVSCCCRRPATVCFIAILLWRAVLSLTVGFFVGFHTDVLDDKVFR